MVLGWMRDGSGWAMRCGRLAGTLTACVVVMALGAAPAAFASQPLGHGPPGGRGGGGGTAVTAFAGNDVSWPQCGKVLPSAPAFGIVGINGGLANDLSACFGPSSSYPSYTQSELYWAVSRSTSTTSEPKASLYVNTADPGNIYNGKPIADWPTSGSTPAYGTCTTTTVSSRGKTYTVGTNSPACAWVYGYDKATQDLRWLTAAAQAISAQESTFVVPATASSYPWWLDIETGNTWQSGSAGVAMNVADLQGVVAALHGAGVSVGAVGVYSTSSQWGQIAGTTTASSGSLFGLPDWVPGATTESGAVANCALSSFTGGSIQLAQWTGTFDNDHVC